MSLRTVGQISLIVVLSSLSGWGADTNPALREAKQTFMAQIRKKTPAERIAAIEAFAAFPHRDSADLILKRGTTDNEPAVRLAAQKALRKLAEDGEVRKFFLEELKRSLKKAVTGDAAAELLRAVSCIEDEAQQTEVLKLLDEYLASPKGNLLLPITLIDDFGKQGDAEALHAVTLFSRAKAFEAKFGYQRCVVQAMTHIRDHEAVTFLIILLPQTQGLIQYDIVQYLTKLTSQKFGDNDREWYKWWKENKAKFEFPKLALPTADVALNDGKPTYYGLPVCAKRVVFVLDTSGSMRGEPLASAKAALISVIEKLPPEVRFDVVMFDKTALVWQPRLVPATTQAKTEIASLIRNRGMGKGTASFAALEAAFGLEPEAVYFLSDGRPTDSQPDQIYNTLFALNRTRRVSLYTIGLVTDHGNAADLILFMKPLAEQNFGNFQVAN